MIKVHLFLKDFSDPVALAEAIIELHAAGYEVFLEGVGNLTIFPEIKPSLPPYTSPPFVPTPTIPGWPPTIISNASASPSDYKGNPNTGWDQDERPN